jgi:hypothetical protein
MPLAASALSTSVETIVAMRVPPRLSNTLFIREDQHPCLGPVMVPLVLTCS